MKSYIGTKVVQAELQMKEFKDLGGARNEPGYKVVYEDGYVSWSPKNVFERCYREISSAEKELIFPQGDCCTQDMPQQQG